MLQQAARRDAGLKLLALAREATLAADAILKDATAAVRARVRVDTHTVDRLFDREQRATHGLAWLATYAEGIRQVGAFAERAHGAGALSEVKELLVAIGIGEFLAQILGGIPMSQGEIVRPADLGLSIAAVAAHMAGPLEGLMVGQRAAPRAAGDVAARPQRFHRRRSGRRRSADGDARRGAQIHRERGDAARAWLAPRQ